MCTFLHYFKSQYFVLVIANYNNTNYLQIILWDLNEETLIETCGIVKQKYNVDIDYQICDITDYKLVEKLVYSQIIYFL